MLKVQRRAVEVVKEMVKIIRSKKCRILWLAYQLTKTFEKFKANDIFINLVKSEKKTKKSSLFTSF